MAYFKDQLQSRSLKNTCTHWERIRKQCVHSFRMGVMHSSGMGGCVGWAAGAKPFSREREGELCY